MAKTRRRIQWDDLDDGMIVRLTGPDRSIIGVFRGYKRYHPLALIEDTEGRIVTVHIHTVRQIAVLQPIQGNRGDA